MERDDDLAGRIERAVERAIADTAFSGAVRVDLPDHRPIELAAGFADRRWRVDNRPTTRFAIASGTKGFTALVVIALVERGVLDLATTARSLLGADLPLIDDAVTVEQLLAHRSGIGDYLDESTLGAIDEHVMQVPVHQLDSCEAYLRVLGGYEQVSPPGERFAYNNGGYVVLALIAERASGTAFATLVDELVCRPAGLVDTAFERADALPPGVATGYLDADGWRTNSLHLPVLGSGDGGLTSSTADIARLWRAFADGRIVDEGLRDRMTTPRGTGGEPRYGLGFWMFPGGPQLVGYDAGISFRTFHLPHHGITATVVSNTSEGAWQLGRTLAEVLDLGGRTGPEG